MLKKNITILLLFLLSCSELYAKTTEWQNYIGGKARFILSPSQTKNIYRGAVELQVAPGWKSFWRNPGSNGMAPNLNLENTNMHGEIYYPAPQSYEADGEWANIYRGHIFLPIQIDSTKNEHGDIKGTINIGLCKNLCVPINVRFAFKQSELKNIDFVEQNLIEEAFAALPKPAKPADIEIKNTKILVSLPKAHSEKPELFLDGGDLYLKPAKFLGQKNNKSLFYTIAATKPQKGQIIYYTLVDGDKATSGKITL